MEERTAVPLADAFCCELMQAVSQSSSYDHDMLESFLQVERERMRSAMNPKRLQSTP